MKDLDVSPFEPEDLEGVIPRPIDREWGGKLSQITRDNGFETEKIGPAYTARLDNRVVFCAGIYILWEGVGEIWSIVDERATGLAYEIFIWQSQLLSTEIKKRGFNRLQAHVAKKWVSACKYMKRLGFVQEAVMRKYGVSGDDYILYGRVF